MQFPRPFCSRVHGPAGSIIRPLAVPIFPHVLIARVLQRCSFMARGPRRAWHASRPSAEQLAMHRPGRLLVIARLARASCTASRPRVSCHCEADTRNLTRDWLDARATLPRGARNRRREGLDGRMWPSRERSAGTPTAATPRQVEQVSLDAVARLGRRDVFESSNTRISIEMTWRTLAPVLIGYYESHGYCWSSRLDPVRPAP